MPDVPVPELLDLIRTQTGDVSEARPTRGNQSATTLLVDAVGGSYFVKACPDRPGGRRASLLRETDINPYVVPLSPPILWQARDQGWIALGFEVIEARPSDFAPGSADLPAIIDLLNDIGQIPLPSIAEDWPETRWDTFATPEDAKLFAGDALLYTDIHPDNLLVGQERGYAIDWSWPTRGAGFIDPALLVMQLISAGHTPESAEDWASGCSAWHDADSAAIDAFAAATERAHQSRVDKNPDAEWLKAMLDAAQKWTTHRGLNN